MRANAALTILTIFGFILFPNIYSYGSWAELEGGTISVDGSTFICASSKKDSKININVTGESGKTFTFLSVDEGEIIEKIQKSKVFHFKNSSPGTKTIYHVSYDKKNFNASEGMNFTDINGEFDLSNPLEITIGDVVSGAIALENGGSEATLCAGAEDPEPLEIQIIDESTENREWIITDKKGEILMLPEAPPFDLSGLNENTCYIYLLSFEGEISGVAIGSRIKKIDGCHALSNAIVIHKETPEGGTIEGDSLFFCIGNRSPDKIHGNDIRLNGESKSGIWVITDTSGVILSLPKNPHQPNFDDDEPGICNLWYLAYAGDLQGLEIGANVEDIEGCFDFSNSIAIVKSLADGGHLENGIVKACVEEGEGLFLSEDDFMLSDTAGTNFAWVVTERNKTIVGFGDSLSNIDLSESGLDKFFVYFLAYADDMVGLEIGNRISDLTGCFDFSNQVPVNVSQPIAGELSGEVTLICGSEEEGIILDLSNLEIMGSEGGKSGWIITDDEDNIVAFKEDLESIQLTVEDTTTYTLFHITYVNPISGIEVGGNISEIDGCFSLSNGLVIESESVEGGILEGGPFSFCLGDGDAFIAEGSITVTEGNGDTSSWVITDTIGNILGTPESPYSVNFADAGPGICLLWTITYNLGLTGLEEGNNTDNLVGCFAFSNSILVARDSVEGGILEGGPFGFCTDSLEIEELIEGSIILTGDEGSNSIWVITDTSGNILVLSSSPYDVDYLALGPGECLIWHLSYGEGLSGLEVGNNVSVLEGCYDFSNSLSVIKDQASAGELTGGPFSFCVGDGIPDTIPSGLIILTGNTGDTSVWVITDTSGIILGIPDSIEAVDFDGSGAGLCLIWHLTFADISGLEVGNSVDSIVGCFDFSNSIEVNRSQSDGGVIEGGPFGICSDSIGLAELVEGSITLSGNLGMDSIWVVTDTTGNILVLSSSPYNVDFAAAGPGECLIWHLSYGEGLVGLEVGNNVSDLEGCYDFSNSITVIKEQASGGELTGGPFSFCVGDGIPDTIPSGLIILTGNTGDTSVWVITDTSGIILGIPDSIEAVDFDGSGAGLCLLWHLTFADISGLEVGNSVDSIAGCYDFSNSIEVNRSQPSGGMLDGGPFSFCVGDGIVDTISNEDILLIDNSGTFNQWVITDTSGVILGLPANISDNDFDGAGTGRCFVWNIAYESGLDGLTVDSLIGTISGCFDLSDSLVVDRFMAVGGSITLDSISTDTSFCTDDSLPDVINPVLIGESGDSSRWITTDQGGIIVNISEIGNFDFEGLESGVFQVLHLSYFDQVEGLEIDSSLNNLTGCFSLSNALTITKLTGQDCTTGLVEGNNLEMRSLQNPVNEEVVINLFSEKSMGLGQMTVRNMEGQTVLTKNIRMVDDLSQQVTLDLYALREGMYFVTVKFPGGMETVKIVKQ